MPPTLKGLVSDSLKILATPTRADQNRFCVVCAEVDDNGRPCVGPAWHSFTADLPDYHGKDYPTVEEAWTAVRPLLERLLRWGWKLYNSDNQPIGADGKVLA